MNKKNAKLIVALDVDTLSSARRLLNKLHKQVGIFKIGPHLFTRYGPEIIKLVHKFNCRVFLDLKLHDIPNTVANTIRQLVSLKVSMLTVHTQGGLKMMKEAAMASKDEAKKRNIKKPLILGVTVLSSFDENDLRKLNIRTKLDYQVLHLARLAKHSGLDGIVLSAKEAKKLRKKMGNNFILICAGIRSKSQKADDQKRVKTPKEAKDAGADYIVVGRPIIKSKRPLKVTQNILREIS